MNEDYSIIADINGYQSVLEHALSKIDFSVGTDIYMLPSNLNVNKGETVGYSKKILISNTDMKIDLNKDINKVYHKKLPVALPENGRALGTLQTVPKMHLVNRTDKPIKDRLTAQHEQTILLTDNRKMLTEKHNDENLVITLLIMGAGLIDYHFW